VAILAADIADLSGRIIVACLMLLGAVAILGVAFWYYRRWQRRAPAGTSSGTWSLDDLRRMREQGQLTEEEYQNLRAAVIQSYAGGRPTETRPRPVGSDDEPWDWVAGQGPPDGFDVKKQSRG
jgi:hypothetical protein